MRKEYSISFASFSGRLKVLLYFNNRVQKSKTFPIQVSPDDLLNPSPALEAILAPIRQRWDDLVATRQSPIKAMFPSMYSETKTPYEFFAEIHDFRLRHWKEYVGENLSWTGITNEYLTNFSEHLQSRGVAPSAIKHCLLGIKKGLDDARLRGYRIGSKNYINILKQKQQ